MESFFLCTRVKGPAPAFRKIIWNLLLQVSLTSKFRKFVLLVVCLWLMLAILATWEAEIGRTEIQDQSWQIVSKTPSPK
jgi:hypothetical protein